MESIKQRNKQRNKQTKTRKPGQSIQSKIKMTFELLDHVVMVLHGPIDNQLWIVHLPPPRCANRVGVMSERRKRDVSDEGEKKGKEKLCAIAYNCN